MSPSNHPLFNFDAPLSSASLGVYVHVPYCRYRCPYCDFYLVAGRPDPRFAHAILDEWETAADALRGRELASLYFGGGTPGLLAVRDLGAIIEGVNKRVALAAGAEVTIEVNPADVSEEAVQGWRAAGVTRISLGVQSVDDAVLRVLVRDHDGTAALSALDRIGRGGFDSFSADLIFGTPGQSLASLDADIRAVAKRAPHVSAYCLTYEAGTNFTKRVSRGRLLPITVDDEADRYQRVQSLLTGLGFKQYEVSNYARPGHEAVHNRLYWSGASTVALGPSAVGYLRFDDGTARRWKVLSDVKEYLAKGPRYVDEERFTREEALVDRMFAGIRDLERGIDLGRLEAEHRARVPERSERGLEAEARSGAIESVGPRHWRLTKQGALVGDRVARSLL